MAAIYLDRPLPTGSPDEAGSDLPAGVCPGRATSYLVLQAVGFTLPATSPSPRCALTAPFHLCLCPDASGHRLCIFCGTFPSRYIGRWPLATTVPCPARTFLPAINAERPPDPLINRLYHKSRFYQKVNSCRAENRRQPHTNIKHLMLRILPRRRRLSFRPCL